MLKDRLLMLDQVRAGLTCLLQVVDAIKIVRVRAFRAHVGSGSSAWRTGIAVVYELADIETLNCNRVRSSFGLIGFACNVDLDVKLKTRRVGIVLVFLWAVKRAPVSNTRLLAAR